MHIYQHSKRNKSVDIKLSNAICNYIPSKKNSLCSGRVHKEDREQNINYFRHNKVPLSANPVTFCKVDQPLQILPHFGHTQKMVGIGQLVEQRVLSML